MVTYEDDLVPIGIPFAIKFKTDPANARWGPAQASNSTSAVNGDLGEDADPSCGWKGNVSQRWGRSCKISTDVHEYVITYLFLNL